MLGLRLHYKMKGVLIIKDIETRSVYTYHDGKNNIYIYHACDMNATIILKKVL